MEIEISRQEQQKEIQDFLFDLPKQYDDYWQDMPEFTNKDCSPIKKITVNFLTIEDYFEFQKTIGQKLTEKTDSIWHPKQTRMAGEFAYGGAKNVQPRYPICIMSKGRWDNQTTGKKLDEMGLDYKFFVEELEAENYIKELGENKVIVMPFNNLGQGSIPARNFIWDWAEKNNHGHHWVMDDNIKAFVRFNNNRRINTKTGGIFCAIENFVDRYENIALAGPNDKAFVPDRIENAEPVRFNTRVYSCTLIDTKLDMRWRGRYNEDTDLCLRVLKKGYCTALFSALLMDKAQTNYADGKTKGMKGGNTDNVYNQNDFRKAFADSLAEQHPDCVKVVWKFNRYHHEVDYSGFKDNKLILKDGIVIPKRINNYGMELQRIKGDK